MDTIGRPHHRLVAAAMRKRDDSPFSQSRDELLASLKEVLCDRPQHTLEEVAALQRIVLYPAGSSSEIFFQFIERYCPQLRGQIYMVADRSEEKHGNHLYGHKVMPPEALSHSHFDLILNTSTAFAMEINNFLTTLGPSQWKVWKASEIREYFEWRRLAYADYQLLNRGI